MLEPSTLVDYAKRFRRRITAAPLTYGCALVLLCLPTHALAQQAQNPSPMVEHTRTHPRLTETTPPGRHQKLTLGALFIPEKLKGKRHVNLLLFFHGGDWLPELAVAQQRNMAVITVQAGAGSSTYEKLFADPAVFPNLIASAQAAAGVSFAEVYLAGWSAGCGAVRQILRTPKSYARVDAALLIDGMHTDYAGGKPGPLESEIDPGNLAIWLQLARDAMAGRKRLIVTHSEIFPGTYASTTETADYLLAQLGLRRRAVLKWGPMGTQQLSEARAGKFRLLGYAGNSAPDHVDQLHSLPVFLRWLR